LIYICIPAHDEGATIGVLLWKVRKVMAEFGRDYEILVLDDASGDDTPAVLAPYQKALPLKVIRSETRLGSSGATIRLLAEAARRTDYPKRDVAVTLQADFTEDPAELVEMVKLVEGGADLVVGRVEEDTLPAPRRFLRKAARAFLRRSVREAPVNDPLSGYRAYRLIVIRKALRELGPDGLETKAPGGEGANLELLSKTIPHARQVAETGYTLRIAHRERESRFRLWPAIRGLLAARGVVWPGVPVAVLALALCVAASPVGLAAQVVSPWTGAVQHQVAEVPFGPGERAEYEVKLGPVSVGTGFTEVRGVETVRGARTYHLLMGINGGIPFARVNNLYQSWLDVESLASRRFIQDQREVRYRRFRHFEFFPEERRWERRDIDDSGPLPTDLPLDDIAFVYFVRTLALEVGETYTLDRYFQADGNPVVIQVIGRDRVTVPAGTFNTIVVRPIIRTRGLFSEGGEAEIHFSDDDRRLMVQLKSRVPVIGSLSLHLKELTPGRPLRSAVPPPDTDATSLVLELLLGPGEVEFLDRLTDSGQHRPGCNPLHTVPPVLADRSVGLVGGPGETIHDV
jgi:hypothetical protein